MRSSSQSFSASCKSFARASTFLSRSCSTSSAWYCSSSKANCKILAHFKTRFKFSSADTVTSSSMCVFTSCLAPDVSSATTAEVSVFPGSKEDKSRDSSRGHCWLRCSPRAGKDSGSMVAASAHNLTLPRAVSSLRGPPPGPARATMASPSRGLFGLGARAPPDQDPFSNSCTISVLFLVMPLASFWENSGKCNVSDRDQKAINQSIIAGKSDASGGATERLRELRERMVKVAIITTSWEDLGGTGKKTGLWYEELAAPFFYFTDKVSCAFTLCRWLCWCWAFDRSARELSQKMRFRFFFALGFFLY